MTCIVSAIAFPTKKALRAALEAGQTVYIKDPSFFAPRAFNAASMQPGQSEVVTNHPKRSYFAKITRKADGSFKVE